MPLEYSTPVPSSGIITTHEALKDTPNLKVEPSTTEIKPVVSLYPSLEETPNQVEPCTMEKRFVNLDPTMEENPNLREEPSGIESPEFECKTPNFDASKRILSIHVSTSLPAEPTLEESDRPYLPVEPYMYMPDKLDGPSGGPEPSIEKKPLISLLRVERYRFLVLIIFCLNSTMNGLTVLQFTTIRKEIMFFYDIDDGAADWTTLLFGVSNVFLLFPSAWFFETKGLRWALGYGVIFNALGHGVKCFCFEPSRFYLLIIGQSVCSLSRVFIFPTPSRLAADWFAAGEVSVASAVAVLAYPVGTALSYMMASVFIIDVRDMDVVRTELVHFQYGLTGASLLILILTLIIMRDKPENPPSVAAAYRREEMIVKTNYLTSIKRFMKNKNYIIHLVSFAFNVSTLNIINVVFTQILATQFPDKLKEIGWLGFYYTMIGVVGAVFSGYVLDKTHRYKLIAVVMYVTSVFACILLTFMNRFVDNVNWLYIPSTLIGVAFMSYMSVGSELGAEITYPESKSTMAGLLYTLVQVFGLVFLPVVDKLSGFFPKYVDIFMMSCFTGLLTIGLLLSAFVKPDYRRQAAENSKKDIVQRFFKTGKDEFWRYK